jgi:DNA-binding NarL/FixJ family response regulator
MKTRIFLVDDHPMLRRGLSMLIGGESDLEICGEARSAGEALQLIPGLQPDVAIVDLALEDGSGMELIKNLKSQNKHIAIVVLTVYTESDYGLRALKAGALAYVLKSAPTDTLLAAIRSAREGHIHVSEETARNLIAESLASKRARSRERNGGTTALTDRELEIMTLIGKGRVTREISTMLHVSVKTVETHRAHLKLKLRVSTAVQLVRACVMNVGAGGLPGENRSALSKDRLPSPVAAVTGFASRGYIAIMAVIMWICAEQPSLFELLPDFE